MKIAVFNYDIASLDIIKVDEEWLDKNLRDSLPEWYEDDEWDAFELTDKIEMFIYEYCDYPTDGVHYMADITNIRKLTPNDFG